MTTLAYRNIGKEVIFENAQIKGVTIESNSPIQYPDLTSWLVVSKWMIRVTEAFGLTETQAFVALLDPTHDFEWVRSAPTEKLEGIRKTVNPFTPVMEEYSHDLAQEWLRAPDWVWLTTFMKRPEIFRRFRPKSLKEFQLMSFLSGDRLHMFQHIRGSKRSPIELKAFNATGRICPKTVRVVERLALASGEYIDPLIILIDDIVDQINEEYLVVSQAWPTLGTLLKAGVKPARIFKGYSKAEANALALSLANLCLTNDVRQEAFNQYKKMSQLPTGWLSEIKSRPVVDWAMAHVAQLSKSRVIHGPAGETQTMHYHQLLSKVTDEMLIRGPKTAFSVVMDRLEEVAAAEIKKQLTTAETLPQLKHEPVDGCEPIHTSVGLRIEGEVMDHCVGGYLTSCMRRKSFIYHIGDPAPGGATLEVCKPNTKWLVQQLLGFKNVQPEDANVGIAQALVKVLNKTLK